MLRKIRILLAVACFAAITGLFLDFTGSLHPLFGWLARIQLLPALLAVNLGAVAALIVATLLFGRIYCSVLCPLGVLQDGAAALGKRARKTATPTRPKNGGSATAYSSSSSSRWWRTSTPSWFCWPPTAPTDASSEHCSPRSTAAATTCWPASPNGWTATPSIRSRTGCRVCWPCCHSPSSRRSVCWPGATAGPGATPSAPWARCSDFWRGSPG